MRHLIAGIAVFAGNAAAHPGHGALEAHLHTWGLEHAVLLFVVAGLLGYALRK